ncbi:hypothetical protein Taro_010427 [Colocasia esculenta]|uniref:GRF-type domain-containing protein n=1 Tax=Colocasia esculenta TaxID=4460 RepID=A0A843UD02_COLES|nr:hypothetical protein [Colocasia esculenta]
MRLICSGMASHAPIPPMRCPSGHGYCVIRISQIERNSGRHYYRCKHGGCEFFMWCDHLTHFVEWESSSNCCCEKEAKITTLECRVAELEEELKQCQSLLKKARMIAKVLPEAFSFLKIYVAKDESDGGT